MHVRDTHTNESLRVILTADGLPDVSEAFMHGPARAGRGCQTSRCVGSMAWSKHFSSLVQEIGLTSSTTEACFFVEVHVTKTKVCLFCSS